MSVVGTVEGDREAIGIAGLGEQRLGLVDVVGQPHVERGVEAVDLGGDHQVGRRRGAAHDLVLDRLYVDGLIEGLAHPLVLRSEEHTSELQSLMRISYAVFCLKNKNN